MAKDNDDKRPLIIIKRVKKVEGGHHGGAWKVAYADFVTAMMAFFLLLWLLSVSTKEAKEAISSYFSPADPRISQAVSGSGGVMGGTTLAEEGAQTDTTAPPVEQPGEAESKEASEEQKLAEKLDAQDQKAFDEAQDQIKQAIESSPELKELAQNLLIDMTPEGLRIQIVDQEGRPMFELGSAKPMPAAEKLLATVAKVVKDLPNQISVRGHTDSKPYGKDASYTNWELSSDRANASRRILLTNDLNASRIENVQGKADREPLIQNDLESPRNRRISLILLKQSLVRAEHKKSSRGVPAATPPKEPEIKKKEEGVIYFP